MPGGRYPWAVRAGGPLLGGGIPPSADFISQWKTDNIGTSNNDQITLPLTAGGAYNFVVNWGDGSADDTITAFNDAAVTHTFTGGAGTFTVTITGQIDGWRFNNSGDEEKLILVSNWGTLNPGDAVGGHFFGCSNMVVTATDGLDTSGLTDMTSMFRSCSSLTSLSLIGFDTSSVTTMVNMFNNCSSLTALNLNSLDTSLVTSMASMFQDCNSLTSLGVNIDTGAVLNMSSMFRDCRSLTSIDVSNFDTSVCTTMNSMFRECSDLVSLDLSDFSTPLLTNMVNMFNDCSSLTSLDVSSFDTADVTSMAAMCQGCVGITTLAMDQAGWDVGLVGSMADMLPDSTLATANYDSILAAWAAQSPSLQSGITFDAGGSVYTIATAQTDRDTLTNAPNSWTINDGGGV